MLAIAAAFAAATCVCAPVAAAPSPFGYDDVYAVVSLSAPQFAPDGSQVAVIVRTADRDGDRWQRRLDLVDVADGAHRTLVSADEGPSSPRWSPSGDQLAYLAGSTVRFRFAAGGAEVRASPEAMKVAQFAWFPDGTALLCVAPETPPPASGDARYLDAYQVGNEPALARGTPPPARLWLVPLGGGEPRRLGIAAGSVAWGDAESTLSFSPDGATLTYLWTPTAVSNDAVHAQVRRIDLRTGEDLPVAGAQDSVRDPLLSPDGAAIAYVRSAGDAQLHPAQAFVAPVAGGASRDVSGRVDRTVRDVAWIPGTRALAFTAHDGTASALFRTDEHGAPRRVDLGARSIASGLDGAFARDGTLAFIGSDGTTPDELYVARPGAAPRRLTAYNAALATRALATTERVVFRTALGVRADAVLTKPAGFRAGTTYPLVLVLHGGPTSTSTETFDELDQLLAARGWLVLEPNYRGSDNAGARYQGAVGGDKLRGPSDDIDAAIAAVRARGIVDGSRLAVSGWSYGAGLTLAMIERRHDWRAAVAGAAVTDIAADYATADDIAADRALAGGSPLVGPTRAAAAAMSPINDVARVRTPLLLMTCRGDFRVSPVGVYEFYHALRDLGRPVELVAYPIDGHFPSDPVRRTDVYRRWVEYIGRAFESDRR
ncbi:MAG TPA: prolyl oligopeptidase family serine peptidase [Candidatus Elarobacter sp.]